MQGLTPASRAALPADGGPLLLLLLLPCGAVCCGFLALPAVHRCHFCPAAAAASAAIAAAAAEKHGWEYEVLAYQVASKARPKRYVGYGDK